MLRVLSYNILLGRKLEAIAVWLKNYQSKFDVLCFQEFPKDKIDFLLKFLKPDNYAFKYGANFTHKGRDYGELTLINSKKIKFLDSKVIFLGTNIIENKIYGLKGERSALLTKLEFNKKTFVLSNTHLIAYALHSQRRSQLLQLIEKLNFFSGRDDHPIILLGDLNYTSLFWPDKIFNLMQSKGFSNAHKEKTHKLLGLKNHQIDYVFYKNCQVSGVKILKLPYSDHSAMDFKVQI